MPHFGVQFLSCLPHFNTSEFNDINPDLQQQVSKITVPSGRTSYRPPGAKVCAVWQFCSFPFFQAHSTSHFCPKFSCLQWDLCIRSEAQAQPLWPICHRFRQRPRHRCHSREGTPTGRGCLCQGHRVRSTHEQGLIYNHLEKAKHSSLSVLVPFGSDSHCRLPRVAGAAEVGWAQILYRLGSEGVR